MRLPRFVPAFLLLASLSLLLLPVGLGAHREKLSARSGHLPGAESRPVDSCASLIAAYHGRLAEKDVPVAGATMDDQRGIREDIPEKYMVHYQQWKREFLSTGVGRREWAFYANNAHFKLTIAISRDNPEGATTGNYKWNEGGELVAATITLGAHLDVGFPNPVYFPVMNSLVPTETSYKIDGSTLAAAKIAHEFGHVSRTEKVDPTLYQLQGQLIPQYNQIFLSNGRNSSDPHLIELASRMGGTPVEVWEDREYWGETNAMLYLSDRFAAESFRCLLFSRIKRSVDLYAKSYEQRFLSVAQSTPSSNRCGWQ
jgi:hypothetical protein